MFLAPNQGIFILIATLLAHGNTKNPIKLRFAEAELIMNTPYLRHTVRQQGGPALRAIYIFL